jgi:hypothetical protein
VGLINGLYGVSATDFQKLLVTDVASAVKAPLEMEYEYSVELDDVPATAGSLTSSSVGRPVMFLYLQQLRSDHRKDVS